MQKTLTLAQTIGQTKIKNVEDLLQNIDAILDLSKNDVKRMAAKNGVYFSEFNHFFYEAVKATKRNIINRTKAFSKIMKCRNVEKVAVWIVGRIFSNMRNFSTNEKYKNYIKIEKVDEIDTQMIDKNDQYLQIDIENDLSKIDKEKMIAGLRKIYHTLDNFEFENLCEKYGINSKEVLGFDNSEAPETTSTTSKSGSIQLAFVL